MFIEELDNQRFVKYIADSEALMMAINYITNTYLPGDIYTERELSEWAFNNGFKKFE